MKFENLITLINTVSSSKLTQFSIEYEGCKITMKADRGMKITAVAAPEAAVPEETLSVPEAVPQENPETEGNVVKSPLVGPFYNAQSPDAEPYVRIGDKVSKGQILGIIEAMKLMNEITSEYDGTVKEILVENEQMVEYGQPLFVIG